MQDQQKSYRFTVRWGEERDTDDAEGAVTQTSSKRPPESDILAILPKFTGRIEQVPCSFSAIKVDGERAYDLARAGTVVELKARPIDIYQFAIEQTIDADHTVFTVTCGKGAYMRALARDLGRELGCFGHLTAIRRLAVGGFNEKNAVSLEKIAEIGHNIGTDSGLMPLYAALDDIPAYACDVGQARILRQGQPIVVTSPKYFSGNIGSQSLIRAMLGDDIIAITKLESGCLIPVRVMAHITAQ